MLRITVPLVLALTAACSSAPDGDEAAPRDVPQARTVERVVVLEHLTPAEAVEAVLEPGLPYQATIAESPRTGALLVSGDEESVARVLDAIAAVDRPGR